MSASPAGPVIDHGLYARVLRRGLPLVLLPAVLGGLLGFGVSLVIPPQYAANSRILVLAIPGAAQATGSRTEGTINLDTEAQLLTSNPVAAPVAEELGLRVFEVRRATAVSVPPNSTVLLVTYTATSPERAVTGADGLAASYLEQRQALADTRLQEAGDAIEAELETARDALATSREAAAEAEEDSMDATLAQLDVQAKLNRIAALQANLDAVATSGQSVGRIIEPARLPTGPSIPNRNLLIASLGALGLLVGLSIALLRERANSALASADDVMRELRVPLLGRVDSGRRLVREEQVENVRRQMLGLIDVAAGCEIVGQDTDLVHAASAELDPPPVPRPPKGERYALLVLHQGDARSEPARTVMETVANRGYRVIGAIFMRLRDEPGGDAPPAGES